MSESDRDWAETHLTALAGSDGARLDLGEAALAFAALDRDVELSPLSPSPGAARTEFDHALQAGGGTLQDGLDALAAVLVERHGYEGDRDSYDDLDNADLTRVIDRRRGLPWRWGFCGCTRPAAPVGTDTAWPFPAISSSASRGPAMKPCCSIRSHPDVGSTPAGLRLLLKSISGAQAELQPEYYAAVDDRAVLLRLQNNIKTRLIQTGETMRAAEIVRRMTRIAPEQPDLWFELSTLCAETGQMQDAILAAERHLQVAPIALRGKADALLQQFQTEAQLNDAWPSRCRWIRSSRSTSTRIPAS